MATFLDGNFIQDKNSESQDKVDLKDGIPNNVVENDFSSIFSLGQGGAMGSLLRNNGADFSEYLSELNKEIQGFYKTVSENKGSNSPDIKFTVIDRSNPKTELACSAVVASTVHDNKIYYFWSLLSHTGQEPLTAGQLLDTFQKNIEMAEQNLGNKNKSTLGYRTNDIYIDAQFHTIVRGVLKEVYQNTNINGTLTFMSCQGMIFNPRVATAAIKSVAKNIVEISYNAIMTEIQVYVTGKTNDINIKDNLVSFQTAYALKMDTQFFPTNDKRESTDLLGNEIRTDFVVTMYGESRNKDYQSYNKSNDITKICSVGGYVDAIPFVHKYQDGYMSPIVQKNRLQPHIIITDTKTPVNTIGFKLLSIVTACTMVDKKNYMMSIYNNIGTNNDAGYLNYITNLLEVDKEEKVAPIDFKGKMNQNEIYDVLNAMYCGDPILSMDFLPFTDQSTVDATFVTAAIGTGDPVSKINACKDIIATAFKMTNGLFPEDFDPTKIFATPGIPFPAGYYNLKSQTRDLRDFDLAMILSYTKHDKELLRTWLTSNTAEIEGRFDPFFAKLKVFSAIGNKQAIVYGRGTRVTFSALFIQTLLNAVMQSGLNPEYTEVGLTGRETLSYEHYSLYNQQASLQSGVHFGQPIMQSFGSYRPGFVYTSMGRTF